MFVFVVENDPDSSDALETLLEIEGFSVAVGETADRALERLIAGDRPEAIVLDVWTPGLSASEFLRRKARHSPQVAAIPVVALSGDPRSLEELERSAPGGGLAATMHKPFDIDELVDLVRGLVRGRAPGLGGGRVRGPVSSSPRE